jgi:hypothetical protein
MAYENLLISDDRRLVKVGGPQTNFETDFAGALSVVAAEAITLETSREMIERMIQKEKLRGPESQLLGPRTGTLGFQIPMRGGKLKASPFRAASPFYGLAPYCGLAVLHTAGTTGGLVTGGSANTIEALDADFADYNVAFMVMHKPQVGDPELRLITDRDSSGGTTTLTVTPDFTVTPTAGDDILPLDQCGPWIQESPAYAAFEIGIGKDSPNRRLFRFDGCAGTFTIPAVATGLEPKAEFSFMSDRWTESDNDLDWIDDVYADPALMLQDQLYLGGEAIDNESFGFDPALELIPMPGQKDGAVSDGRIGWFFRNSIPVFTIAPYFAADFYTWWANRTLKELVYTNVQDEYQAWGIGCLGVQIVGQSPGAFAGGLVGSTVALAVVDPGDPVNGSHGPLWVIATSGTD